jgi:hypothetical protein
LRFKASPLSIENWFKKRRKKLNETTKGKNNKFNETITHLLNEEYKKNKFPDKQTKYRLASKVSLTSQQVENWFKNTRKKLKDTKKKNK